MSGFCFYIIFQILLFNVNIFRLIDALTFSISQFKNVI